MINDLKLCTGLLLLLFSLVAHANEKPNIVLIIADDAGYHDFGFQGSKVMKTPEIDKLAQQSIIFDQAYVTAAVCGPSRAGILTGKYQQRFGFEENNVTGYMSKSGLTGDDMGLPLEQKTIADHLTNLGYRTGLFGKWHQGNHDKFHPTQRGFDEFYGFRGGARDYFAYTNKLHQVHPALKMERNYKQFVEHEGYLTDALAMETNNFITQAVLDQQPFFAVLSFSAVHAPMQATANDLAHFPNLSGQLKVLAAMNFAMDRAVGSLLKHLKIHNVIDNTLVVFINDNGGPTDQNSANNAPLSGTKANHLEGGIRVPMLLKLPKQLKTSKTHYPYPVSSLDLVPTFINAAKGKVDPKMQLNGVNLLPYLATDNALRPHDILYWKKETRAAIRHGDLKLLRFPDRPVELYDLSKDEAEQHNLAASHPEKVLALMKALFKWELTLERPLWQLKREYEGQAMSRMDTYRKPKYNHNKEV
ncbi:MULTISPECIES: sulfatase-like hydrolase/transferase [unclassified Shewanella]|uniref:sulfatase-like hydrolase/transferase n=1 Tax=unclassified Shewanella TaxID=196818 RepID=UPI000C8345CA|nr:MULTISPECIES: sulfatase-like hydrolase/transferase [unclassified Shewanella]MDO6776161.1 sulfatase-like hydrolase/transferase [Shewanella sp. 3_MG-2023]PMI02113.1 sulfatase [Shewanella sp. 10N.286.48.A6]